jgi:glyoxylase-like metal-dependent hydrolase (beta-lactamase superfamily II)
MRVHVIQTGTVAIKTRQVVGVGHGLGRRLRTLTDTQWTEPLPIYAWVIEHPEGILVVDTGETARATQAGYFPRWHPYYRGVREWVRPEDEVGPQLQRLGLPPDEVRWVVLTHMHTDHAGGLAHFPKSEIVLSRTEYEQSGGWLGQLRGYLPQHRPAWLRPRLLDFTGQPFGPFPTSVTLTAAGDVAIVPTPGHTAGHMSVLLREEQGLIAFAGDTSYTQELLMKRVIDGVTTDERAERATQERLLALARTQPLVYLPSHDPESPRRMEQREPLYMA